MAIQIKSPLGYFIAPVTQVEDYGGDTGTGLKAFRGCQSLKFSVALSLTKGKKGKLVEAVGWRPDGGYKIDYEEKHCKGCQSLSDLHQ